MPRLQKNILNEKAKIIFCNNELANLGLGQTLGLNLKIWHETCLFVSIRMILPNYRF